MGVSRLTDYAQGFTGQCCEVTSGEIFLSELDEIDVSVRCLGDLIQQGFAASGFIAMELSAIGDVVTEHQVIA